MTIIFDLEKHFLGKLCKHGHDWENSGLSLRYKNTEKKCVICKNERERTYQKANKERVAERQRLYRQENADKLREQSQNYYQENVDKILEYQRNYRKENPDKISEYHKENADKIRKRTRNYYQENADKYSEKHKIYYQENAEKLREYSRNYHKENPDKAREYRQENADKIREYGREYGQTPVGKNNRSRSYHKRRAMKNKCHSQPYKREDILNLFNGECAYCGSKVNLTLDHFIPINKGGSDVQGNLLPACLSCNSSKCNNDAIEWYKKQSFFSQKRLKQILKILGKTESNYDQIPLF